MAAFACRGRGTQVENMHITIQLYLAVVLEDLSPEVDLLEVISHIVCLNLSLMSQSLAKAAVILVLVSHSRQLLSVSIALSDLVNFIVGVYFQSLKCSTLLTRHHRYSQVLVRV